MGVKLGESWPNRTFFQRLTLVANFGILFLIRFLISLDQFIPAINLKVAENWQPPELSLRTWCWLQFERISGWILIPIGLAAIYSQFK